MATETPAAKGRLILSDNLQREPDEKINKKSSIAFFLLHILPFLAVFTGVTLKAVLLGFVLYWSRVFFITAGYHRYFSHKTYKLNRFWQFLMAFGGTTAAQKGPLWWAAHHRDHHRYSDTANDIHSPLKGFWWSHAGWILCDKYNETKTERIKDFAKYPELRFLNKYDWIGPWTLGVFSFLFAGLPGLLIGFFGSTVLLWHSTFMVNSLAHVWGGRRYDTSDTSRNNLFIAIATMGEGWHNNHHHYQSTAKQGFYWWEWDPSYYIIYVGEKLGIVKNLRKISKEKRSQDQIKALPD
jgi:stearoyl-CoA desaturase (delta-9 desaturase)